MKTGCLSRSEWDQNFVERGGRYGGLTIEGYTDFTKHTGKTLAIYLNGVDVTTRCVYANDVHGKVVLRCGDLDQHEDWHLDGPIHMGTSWTDACSLQVRGNVQIKLAE